MRKIIAISSIALFAVLHTSPALSDPPPMIRVFGCVQDRFDFGVGPGEYVVSFGGDVEEQLCEDLLNSIANQYEIISIAPASLDAFGAAASGEFKNGLVYHAERKVGQPN